MIKTKVSYILCVHNGEKTLGQTLNSLLSQQDIDLEIIAVDDGSTDTSINILKKYQSKSKRIKIFSQPNLGLSLSRNRGILLSTGDFIASAAQDDIYLPEKSIKQVRFLEEKHLDFCFTNVQTIDEKGSLFYFRSMFDYNFPLFPWPVNIIEISLYDPVCSPTFLCRRKCYEKIVWNSGFLTASDLNLTLKMFFNFKGGKLQEKLLYKRIRLTEHDKNYKPVYGLKFMKFERRLAVACAFVNKYIPNFLLPSWHLYFRIIKLLIKLENNNKDITALSEIADIYNRLGFKLTEKKLNSIASNL